MKKMLRLHQMALILSPTSLNASSMSVDLRQFGRLVLDAELDQVDCVSGPTWDVLLALLQGGIREIVARFNGKFFRLGLGLAWPFDIYSFGMPYILLTSMIPLLLCITHNSLT